MSTVKAATGKPLPPKLNGTLTVNWLPKDFEVVPL